MIPFNSGRSLYGPERRRPLHAVGRSDERQDVVRIRERLKQKNVFVPVVVGKNEFPFAERSTFFPTTVAADHIGENPFCLVYKKRPTRHHVVRSPVHQRRIVARPRRAGRGSYRRRSGSPDLARDLPDVR